MSLSRKMLKAMGIEDEKIEQIIEAHTETVDSLKEDRDKFKEEAEKVPELQKQIDAAKKDNSDVWKVKYESLKEDFDNYKNDIDAKATLANKEKAYRELLKAAGIAEKRIDSVLKVSDYKSLELDDKGKFKDSDKLTEGIKKEWEDFIQKKETKGADTATPPGSNGGSSLTKEQIYAKDEHGRYKLSTSERQEALRSMQQ